jgi:DNA mismatch repair protein MutL
MPKVELLPPEVAEKIAAGEVVERPVSVVKELVENAVDAGASSISVELEKGGKNLIRVSDDGLGMSRDDLALAFHRHATSKIRSVDDLFSIRTMGFRGEALASISAVARVRALTRAESDDSGWEASVEPLEPPAIRPAGRGRGTTIEVRDLFFNIPARKKFLSRDETEVGHVTRFMQAIALSFPGVAMSLSSGTRSIFSVPAADSIRRRVAVFYGEDLAADLVEAQGGLEGLSVYALLAPPFYSRTNSHSQYTYVNARFVRDRVLSGALAQSFQGVLEQRRYPIAFVYVTIAPADVDVNVHPTKMEIRFRDSAAVRSTVSAVLSEALLRADFAPRITEALPSDAPRAGNIYRSIEAFYDRRIAPGALPGSLPAAWPASPSAAAPPAALAQGSLLQVRGTYIVQETDEGIAIIDQHALHERIVYAEVSRRLAEGNLQGQRFLIPEVVEVTPEEKLAVENSRGILARLGIDVEVFGDNAVAFNSFPAVLPDVDRQRLTRDVIADLLRAPSSRSLDGALTALAEVIACHAAVRAGEVLNREELSALMERAEHTQSRYACPHGRPTKLVLTFDELERRFKRR